MVYPSSLIAKALCPLWFYPFSRLGRHTAGVANDGAEAVIEDCDKGVRGSVCGAHLERQRRDERMNASFLVPHIRQSVNDVVKRHFLVSSAADFGLLKVR